MNRLDENDLNDLARMKHPSPLSWPFLSGAGCFVIFFGVRPWTIVAVAVAAFFGAKAWWFPPKAKVQDRELGR